VLATVQDVIAGLEVATRYFFLPFHTKLATDEEARDIADTVTKAILEYRRKKLERYPSGSESFSFTSTVIC